MQSDPAGGRAAGGATSGAAGSVAAGGAGGLGRAGGGGDASISRAGSTATGGHDAGGTGGAGMAGAGMAGAAANASAGMGAVGLPPLGPELTDVTKLEPASCAISATVTPAADIGMVGVATFSTDFAEGDRAIIQFGKTQDYTLEAPVNWAATEHRTWLLGMPADTTVHYRVVVMHGDTACIGNDATYQTGAAPDGTPANNTPVKGASTAAPTPGFIIAELSDVAYIVNIDGEVVWAHRFPVKLSRAALSWDGMYLYARDMGALSGNSGGAAYRVALDGSGETNLGLPGATHHDLTPIPTGIAYIGRGASEEFDSIYTAGPDGSNPTELVNLEVVLSHFDYGEGVGITGSHVNAIHYYRDTQSYSISDREKDMIAFFSSKGELLGSVGATPISDTPNHAKAEGADSKADSVWRVQHGHDQYAPNKLVLWSNGTLKDGTSHALHYTIDGTTATLDWQYTGAGTSGILGDTQHLPSGHFLITNSDRGTNGGVVQEIDEHAEVIQSFAGLSAAYSCHRSTLYGPPPGR